MMKNISIIVKVLLVTFLWANIGMAQTLGGEQQKVDKCLCWQSLIDPSIRRPEGVKAPDTKDEQSILEGIDCLLKLEGKKSKSKIAGATSPYASQTFGSTSVEVAALYFISYLYYEKWDHALAAQLVKDGRFADDKETIQKAYLAYKAWYKEIKKVGIAKAKEIGMNPLKGTGISWYGVSVE